MSKEKKPAVSIDWKKARFFIAGVIISVIILTIVVVKKLI